MHSRYAASADIGSNSIHLIVAEISGRSLRVVHQEKEILRIGFAPQNEKKIISSEFTLKTAGIINRFLQVAGSYGAPLKIVATSAVRESANAAEFVRDLYAETGIRTEIISGHQEAGFIYSGVMAALPWAADRQCLCIDIGGGSTELIIGKNGRILFSESLKLGAVRLTERFFPDYILTDDSADQCCRTVKNELEPFLETIKRTGFEISAGTSGTVMSAAMIHKYSEGGEISTTPVQSDPLTEPLNDYTIPAGEISDIAKAMINFRSAEERKTITGLEAKRADIFPAGLFILDAIVRMLGVPSLTVSAFSLREGLLIRNNLSTEALSDQNT
ncbi:MAG: Ppx/GppA phosphatase family protein [Bacteroidota bacterium]